ncbi:hypothetical protein CsSME_00029724 [Camellia sinensis var. sinensis]
MVGGWWRSYRVVGGSSCRLAQKLKLLKADLKRWNVEVFRNVKVQKANILAVLHGLDEKETEGSFSMADAICRVGAWKDYAHVARMEEISYRQKSKCLWLKDGDRNTKFFYWMANAHRRANQIGKERVNGVLFSSEGEVKAGIVSFYQHLFRDEGEVWRPTLDGSPFTEEEVLGALSMPSDKALGLNGGERGGDGYGGGGGDDIRDFRPISLLGSVYKLLAEVLANRLRTVLEGMVSESQNTFVGGFWMLCWWPMSVWIHGFVKRKGNGLWGKIEVLDAVLYLHCAVVDLGEWDANGFLFDLERFAMSCHISRAVQGGLLSGFEVGSGSAALLAVSGLRVNLAMSELILVGEMENVPMLAVVLGCKVTMLPVSYLGLPLGASFKETKVWDGVVDRVQRRLARWKRQYLSKGGRITLIKSVISSIPTSYRGISCGIANGRAFIIIWCLGRGFVLQRRGGAWGGGGWWCLIVLFWGSSCGGLRWKGSACEGGWWWPSMGWGVQIGCANPKGVVCGRGFVDVEELVASVRVRLRCNVQDWELDQLVGLLYKLRFGGDGEDTLLWVGLRAKGFFRYLGVFPWKTIWVVGSSSKVAFFVWTAALNRILTIDNLIWRRHVSLPVCVSALKFDCCFIWSGLGAAGVCARVLHSWGGARVGKRRQKA